MTNERIMKMLEKYELTTGCETIEEEIKITVEAIAEEFPINNFTSDMKQFIIEALFWTNRNKLDQEEKEVIDWLAAAAKKEIEKYIIDDVRECVRKEIADQLFVIANIDSEKGKFNISNIIYNVLDDKVVVTPNGLIRWKQRKFLGGYKYKSAHIANFTHEEELEIRRLRALKCIEYVALNLKNSVFPSFKSVDVDGYDIIVKF